MCGPEDVWHWAPECVCFGSYWVGAGDRIGNVVYIAIGAAGMVGLGLVADYRFGRNAMECM